MARAYDYVIYDTPPVGTFIDAAIMGTFVDGCVLAVKAGRAKRSELQLAYEQLTNAGANVLGLCATFVEGTGSEYYYSYYTKDGKSTKKMDVHVEEVMDERRTQARVASIQAVEGASAGAQQGAGAGAQMPASQGAPANPAVAGAPNAQGSPTRSVPRSVPRPGAGGPNAPAPGGAPAPAASPSETGEIVIRSRHGRR